MTSLAHASFAAVVSLAGVAHAGSITVDTTNDSGAGSLRDAITQANAAGTPTTIDIVATGTINLVGPLPVLTAAMTITGPGADQLTIQPVPNSRFSVFTIRAAVSVAQVTVANGGIDGPSNQGGGFNVQGGSLSLSDSVVSGNHADLGAAIFANGDLTVTRSVISGNVGQAGALYAIGETALIDTTIVDNDGTAIVFPPAQRTLTIDRCTVARNRSHGGVGGLQLQGGAAVITNSTFSGNTGLQGGDFWTYSDGVFLELLDVTAAGSSAPSLLFDHAATVTARNTIFAGAGANCSPRNPRPAISAGHNLATDDTCNLVDATDKPSVANPGLGPLADNGGLTFTHALLPGSPAIDAGDSTMQPSTDQRGAPRIQGSATDIGAFETRIPAADLGVELVAQAGPLLAAFINYTLTARNHGPDPVGAATLTATLPAGMTATNLGAGCTASGNRVICTFGAIASGASASRTFRLPLPLLGIGQRITVTATRTSSTPTDPNPANDNASATCTATSILLVSC